MNIGSQIPASISQNDPLKQAVDVQLMRKTRDMAEQQTQQLLASMPKTQVEQATHPHLGQRIDIRF